MLFHRNIRPSYSVWRTCFVPLRSTRYNIFLVFSFNTRISYGASSDSTLTNLSFTVPRTYPFQEKVVVVSNFTKALNVVDQLCTWRLVVAATRNHSKTSLPPFYLRCAFEIEFLALRRLHSGRHEASHGQYAGAFTLVTFLCRSCNTLVTPL
jgi:hypothetical protein